MQEFIDEKAKMELRKTLSGLASPVSLLFFTKSNPSPACSQQQELLEELASVSNRLGLRKYDFVLNGDEVSGYRIDKTPATAVVGKKDYGIRFYGLTSGHEFASLIKAILMVSTGQSGLRPEVETLVMGIEEKVHLQVFATLTCPYCPRMVHLAHQFAFVNDNIRADMVDVSEFNHLAQRYNVTGVPKTVINEVYSFEGALDDVAVYLEVLKAVNPEKYGQLMEKVQAIRKTKSAEEKHEYEVVIVGGGPAAMSAAVYSARKGLDVALIAKKLGGQISYTASVENYLGLPIVSGNDMVELFHNHLENYPVAESLGTYVVQVKKEDNYFVLVTGDNQQFRALSVIFCAGKEYLRLGVPGEERFIGKGIGFCATCDAPLYRGKRVAVVGGGNSAFTAVRDLLSFASMIYLIHRRDEFTADQALVQEVAQARNVAFHTSMIVESFLGKDNLTGLRLRSVDGKDRLDLSVDGVFLEVGLKPNSEPLKGLIELNEWGEVPVENDQSTTVKGLFAAGDVTNSREKQISIAVGQGASAALSAYRYLVDNRLIQNRAGLKETWQQ